MFLVDTSVIVETRRRQPDANVLAWFQRTDPARIHVSVLTLAEILKGAALLAGRDPSTGTALVEWVVRMRGRHGDRIVGIDAEIAEAWAQMTAARPISVIDGLLAATASVRGLTLVTRDVRPAAALGVAVLDPWQP